MELLKRYRFLLIVVGLSAILTFWEPSGEEDDKARISDSNRAIAMVLAEIYPDGDELYRAVAIDRVQKGKLIEAKQLFEQALSKGVKTNEDNFYFYAMTLVSLKEPKPEVDRAVETWKYHFPYSNRPDPRTLIKSPKLAE